MLRDRMQSSADQFDRVVSRHKDAVYRQLLRMCGNREDAEDVLVDSLVRAYQGLDDLRDDESFRAWLVQIGRRTCVRLKQKASQRPIAALPDLEAYGFEIPAATTPEHELFELETKRCVMSAFESLPPIYQEVYRLRELEQRSAEEVAGTLGLTIPALKSRLHRARALVRQALDDQLCEPS